MRDVNCGDAGATIDNRVGRHEHIQGFFFDSLWPILWQIFEIRPQVGLQGFVREVKFHVCFCWMGHVDFDASTRLQLVHTYSLSLIAWE